MSEQEAIKTQQVERYQRKQRKAAEKRARRRSVGTGSGVAASVKRVPIYVFLIIVMIVQLLPFYLAITTSMKPADDLSSSLIPRLHDIAWSNFSRAVNEGGILRAIVNSAIVTVFATALVCIVGAMAAYPLARRKTRGNSLIFGLITAVMMVPPLSILVPLYSMLVKIGGVNTYWGIILVLTAMNLPLSIFLYASFIRAVPTAIDEAGMIDGANRFTIFVKLILPTLKPVTATVVIMTINGVWNDYSLSNYILSDPSMQTIAPRVGAFFATQTNNLGVAAACALIGALPVVIAYLFLQRYFIEGMVAGVEK
ncbi:carbohydrate ABC transporter permease [Bifidobacterium sp. ESL0764]|uniref:carbohydrate ABC transporter permease n=1 Tax=Bifidobacterium sp. ESL0764 TaxID=2983228 RepID=UPI0023F6D1C2|nr:carbohydrate ABC transporter permease [Bifidobacterium sp. ESL0764]WEV65828.1 carbohydrate ABC transporter permease [Bifidobacterium sp. ESL0764]